MSELLKKLLANYSASTGSTTNTFIPPRSFSNAKPRLFALLIGIDFYQYVRSLRCAVSDAMKFKEYLQNYLGVPNDQILTLVNKSASRAAIIDGLTSFTRDSRIQSGDPILIFFAGHGAEIESLRGDAGGKMQCLVPQDYCAEVGKEIPSIPDRTFGALIDLIAEEKGNNITVILDCCHAASGTRGDDNVRVRSVEIDSKIHHPDIDSDIPDIAARSLAITSGFHQRGLRSHTLLAACSSSELCAESTEQGFFSSALLKLFRSVCPDEITYQDVLNRIDTIPSQNPQCEGVNRNRYLFDGKVSKITRLLYTVQPGNDQVVLSAGAAHGIAYGAEFNVYKDEESLSGSPLVTLVVGTLGPFSTTLKVRPGDPSFILDQPALAVQTKAGEREDLRLYIPPEDDFLPCQTAWLSLTQAGKDYIHNIVLLDSPKDAHVELAMKNNRVAFLFRDERITQYGLNQTYFDVEPTVEEVTHVLKALAHYFWKLNLTNNNLEITNSIQVEFYQLDPSDTAFDDDTGIPEMTPILPNICKSNVIDFVIDEDAPYGIKLTNNSNYDFYPHLFYFDNSDLSIAEYYQPPTTSGPYELDVPLKANGGTLAIGYGSGGISPFSYFLRDRQNVDVGFLKLFVSTKPIDLSVIIQSSPFGDTARSLSEVSRNTDETWGTILLPVIQRRYPPTPETHCVQCGSLSVKSLEMHYLDTVNNLEILNKALNEELDLLRQTASDDRHRFQDEISALQTKLEALEKVKENAKEDKLNIQNHKNEVVAPQVAPNTPTRSRFKIAVHLLNFFKRAKRFRV